MVYGVNKFLYFEAVFLPNCENIAINNKFALYNAITRSYQSLFIMHSGYLSNFFENVPNNIYETSLLMLR